MSVDDDESNPFSLPPPPKDRQSVLHPDLLAHMLSNTKGQLPGTKKGLNYQICVIIRQSSSRPGCAAFILQFFLSLHFSLLEMIIPLQMAAGPPLWTEQCSVNRLQWTMTCCWTSTKCDAILREHRRFSLLFNHNQIAAPLSLILSLSAMSPTSHASSYGELATVT